MVSTAELCDRCSASAKVIVILLVDTGQPDVLTLCEHHKDKNADALEAIGARVMPFAALEDLTAETQRMEERAQAK